MGFYTDYKAVFDAVKTALVYVPAVPEVERFLLMMKNLKFQLYLESQQKALHQLKQSLLGNNTLMATCQKLLSTLNHQPIAIPCPWVRCLTSQ
jgi:hypothetical protein